VAAQGLPCGPGGTKGMSNAERRISNVEGGNASVITPFDKLRAALRQAQGSASASSGRRPSRRHDITSSRNPDCIGAQSF